MVSNQRGAYYGVPLRSKCPDIEMLFLKPKISRDVQNMMPNVITTLSKFLAQDNDFPAF